MSTLLVFCTHPDRAGAEALAQSLVERRVAACVSLFPVASTYRWNASVERADEVQLVIKTAADRFDALRDAILAVHPYELPELIAVEAAAGLAPYLEWIGESTRPATGS